MSVPELPQSWKLLDDIDARLDGRAQMARDLMMAAAVRDGSPPLVRFYRWFRPTLSLGRFQEETAADIPACHRLGVDVAHRPTGGRALLHGSDLTYAVAMPRPNGRAGHVEAVYRLLAQGILAGLAGVGVRAEMASDDGHSGPACFASSRGTDLRVDGRKICGSAQVVRDGVVLQHGSILLTRLAIDECDVLAFTTEDERRREQQLLRERTVTLRELGVDVGARALADALGTGLEDALGIDLNLELRSRDSVAAVGDRR